jgi:hypothetical protein
LNPGATSPVGSTDVPVASPSSKSFDVVWRNIFVAVACAGDEAPSAMTTAAVRNETERAVMWGPSL